MCSTPLKNRGTTSKCASTPVPTHHGSGIVGRIACHGVDVGQETVAQLYEFFLCVESSWRSVKNAFALMTNKGIYENQRKVKNNSKRSVQMTRCGTFGIQHYGTFSWSGDVSSNWDVMKNQIPSGLNYSP